MHTNKFLIGPILLIPFALILLVVGCVAPVGQFYPDSYFSEDRIYQNKPIGFQLRFSRNWNIQTDPQEMWGAGRDLAAQLRKRGAELLFIGATVEQNQGVRAIAANLNLPDSEYAEQIRKLNSDDIEQDFGLTDIFISGERMIRWDYVTGGFRFVEFYFKVDTYNIRIAFWSMPSVFDRFEPVYLDIISSLSLINRL